MEPFMSEYTIKIRKAVPYGTAFLFPFPLLTYIYISITRIYRNTFYLHVSSSIAFLVKS